MGQFATEEPDRRILEAFRVRYRAGAPFRQDRELAEELVLEASPAVEALLFAQGAGAPDDAASLEHHEGLAMVTLLGRRAGTLGVTPTAALGLVNGLANGFASVDRPLGVALLRALRAVFLEGYVAGREDLLNTAAAERAADAQAFVAVVPGCLALLLAGEQEADVIEEVVERFGRALLASDAKACIIDVSRLSSPTPDRAAEVLAADGAARMLGVSCVFVGTPEPWIDAARGARVNTDLVVFEPTFEVALRRVLPLCGLQLRRTSWLPGPLKSLLGRD